MSNSRWGKNPATVLKQLLVNAGVELNPEQLKYINRIRRFCARKVKPIIK